MRSSLVFTLPALGLVGLVALVGLVGACDREAPRVATSRIGDVARGRVLAHTYGCNTCHEIPGVHNAQATVGPSLARLGVRVYAGSRLNNPGNLVEFLLDPHAIDPETPMPSVGLTERDARDVVAFLFTLR